MIELAGQMLTDDVLAIGIGAAGMVDAADGSLRCAPNIAWRELPIASRMRDAIGLPSQVDNDASMAAYGEYGFAAEIGHIIVEPGRPKCGGGNLGCLEQVAGGRAIDRLGRERARAYPDSLLARLASGDPESVTGQLVTKAATRGDDVAIGVLAEAGRRLGEGIAGLVNILDSQIVVVGGGAVVAGDLLLEPARAAFGDAVEGEEHRPRVPIVAARLGNDAGAVGAATLALEELGRMRA